MSNMIPTFTSPKSRLSCHHVCRSMTFGYVAGKTRPQSYEFVNSQGKSWTSWYRGVLGIAPFCPAINSALIRSPGTNSHCCHTCMLVCFSEKLLKNYAIQGVESR